MRTYNEIFLEVRNAEIEKQPYAHLFRESINGRAHEEAAKRYAIQVAQDALNRSANQAMVQEYAEKDDKGKFIGRNGHVIRCKSTGLNYEVFKESITNTEIIL